MQALYRRHQPEIRGPVTTTQLKRNARWAHSVA